MEIMVERMAAAYFEAFESLCKVTPKGWCAERGSARAAVTRAGFAVLNVVYDMAAEPDLGGLDELAGEVGRQGVPWAVMARGEVSDEVADLAARHGLTGRDDLPFLVCAAGDLVYRGGAAELKAVRRVGAAESDLYTRALVEGFEVHEEALESLMGGGVLDAGPITGYLAEESGRAVGTGLGVRASGAVGVFNIAVVPDARGRGLGRAITEAVVRDGVAAGAEAAFLHASAMGLPLYESMGFRVAETWTVFRAQ